MAESPVLRVADRAPSAEQWEWFLARLPQAGPFHAPAWREALLATQPAMRDGTLWLEREGQIRAVLPVLLTQRMGLLRAASQPYGTPGGPWLSEPGDEPAARALLLAFARAHARPWNDCLAQVEQDPALESARIAHWPSARVSHAETHRLVLPDSVPALEALWEHRTRKGLRKAEKLGLELVELGVEGVAWFDRFHRQEVRRRGQAFAYPPALLERATRDGWLRMVGALRAGEPLAITAIAQGHGTWFAWLVAHGEAARVAPTGEFLFGQLLRQAVNSGVRVADFGSSGGRSGARFFKAGFGAQPVELCRWRSGPLAGRSR